MGSGRVLHTLSFRQPTGTLWMWQCFVSFRFIHHFPGADDAVLQLCHRHVRSPACGNIDTVREGGGAHLTSILPYLVPPKMKIHRWPLGSNHHLGLGSRYHVLPLLDRQILKRRLLTLFWALFLSQPTISVPV